MIINGLLTESLRGEIGAEVRQKYADWRGLPNQVSPWLLSINIPYRSIGSWVICCRIAGWWSVVLGGAHAFRRLARD